MELTSPVAFSMLFSNIYAFPVLQGSGATATKFTVACTQLNRSSLSYTELPTSEVSPEIAGSYVVLRPAVVAGVRAVYLLWTSALQLRHLASSTSSGPSPLLTIPPLALFRDNASCQSPLLLVPMLCRTLVEGAQSILGEVADVISYHPHRAGQPNLKQAWGQMPGPGTLPTQQSSLLPSCRNRGRSLSLLST